MAPIHYLLKTLINLIILIFLLLICILGIAIWITPKVSQKIIDTWIEGKTGFTTSINTVDLKFFSGYLQIDNVVLNNPPYYQNKNFIHVNQFSTKVAFKPLFKKQLVFDQMLIDINRLTLVRNPQGNINALEFLNNFKKNLHLDPTTPSSATDLVQPSNSSKKYLIKKLTVQLHSIDIIGFPNENDVLNFSPDFNQEYTDVTDIEEVIKSITRDIQKQQLALFAQEIFNTPNLQAIDDKSQKKIQKVVEKIFPDLEKIIK